MPTQIHVRVTDDLPINAVVTTDIIDDPIELGGRLEVTRSLRDDVLGQLRARDQLRSPEERQDDKRTGRNTGEARYQACRRWQQAWELSEIGGARAIDPTKEAVDGGGQFPEFWNDTHRKAVRDIVRARNALGLYGQSLIEDVLVRHKTLTKIAGERMMKREIERAFLGKRFRECMETLTMIFGLTNLRVRGS